MLPLISVIVPVYNVEKYLKKCVDSILAQTYSELEIILVNDGSTDSSPKICDVYAKKDSRVKVLHKKNGGVSSARNEGINASNGSYIGFVDSDDWINEDFFQVLLETILTYDADISICGFLQEESNGLSTRSTNVNEYIVFNNIDAIKEVFDGSIFAGHLWNKLYKAELVRSNEFNNNIHMCEDQLFNIQIMINASKMVFVPEFGYRYVTRETSTTKLIDNKYVSIIEAHGLMREVINRELPEIIKYCNKPEMRSYIRIVINIIENGASEKVDKGVFIEAVRELLNSTNNKRVFGTKYLLLGLILSLGYLPFKVFYLLIGKRFLRNRHQQSGLEAL